MQKSKQENEFIPSRTALNALNGQLPEGEKLNNQNSSLVTIKAIEDTPFTIVGDEEKGYFLAFGRHRISESLETEEEVKNLLKEKPWQIIADWMVVMYETIHRFAEIDKENERQAKINFQNNGAI